MQKNDNINANLNAEEESGVQLGISGKIGVKHYTFSRIAYIPLIIRRNIPENNFTPSKTNLFDNIDKELFNELFEQPYIMD